MRAAQVMEGDDDTDDPDKVDGSPAIELTDSQLENNTPSSPKMHSNSSAGTLTLLSSVLSTSSLQAGNGGTLSRARHMRMSQVSTTLGRAVMQFNEQFQKESSPGRKSSVPGRNLSTLDRKSVTSLDGDGISSTAGVRPVPVKGAASSRGTLPKEESIKEEAVSLSFT